jgi:glycosyltransferase involved in cell wall biosynthesis
MKIALLGTINHFGGGPRTILELAKRFSKEHEINIITDLYDPDKTFREFESFPVETLNPPFNKFPLIRRHTLVKRWIGLDLSKYDICLSNTFYSNIVALNSDNVIIYIHTTRLPVYSPEWSTYSGIFKYVDYLGYLPFKEMEKKSVKGSRKVIANSNFVKEKIDKYYDISSEVIYPGVSFSEFYSRPSEDFCIYAGRIVPSKRIETIIKAWENVEEDVELYIIGSGDEKYVNHLKSLGNKRIKFTGPLESKELRDMYARCLCTIYIPKEEDFGLVPLEAMASGKPVIAADEGGLKEIINDERDGFLIPAEPGLVAEKVNLLFNNKQTAKKIGKMAKERAREFDWDIQAGKLMKVIQEVVN